MKAKEIKLNAKQLEAVNKVKGNLLIVASAGTGKTTTIVERYANLVGNHGHKPNEIMMTTFTNKAAKDMLEKIRTRMGKVSEHVGTMHSLFLRILKEHAELLFDNPHFTIIEDYEKEKIMKQILIEEGIDERSDNKRYFLYWIGKYKNAGIYAENLSLNPETIIEDENNKEILIDDELLSVNPVMRARVNKIYKRYEDILKNRNLIDFDSMLLLTQRLFEDHPRIKDKYANQFKAIMVDEAQDLNPVQMNILGHLKRNNLCLIGDDCQNIFTWRGSSNALVFDFNENEHVVTLKENYRSTKNIISSINKIIDSLQHKISKELICTRDKGNKITIEEFDSFQNEVEFIIDSVKELIKKRVKKDEIALLFRTNRIGQIIEREFRKNKIPCHLSKTIDFFKREEIRDLISFLKLKVNYKSVDDFEKILLMVEGVGRSKIDKLKSISENKNIPIADSLKYIQELQSDLRVKTGLARIKDSLENYDKHPIELFLNHLGYRDRLINKYKEDVKKLKDKFENIKVMKGLFKGYGYAKEGIRDFLHSLIELDKKEKTKDKVVLSTIHSAKGLEWKHVFLVQCNERTLPFYSRKKLDNIKKDEELRLFYVAVSRAKDFLTITYSRDDYLNREQEPSQFLEIIE